MPLIPLTFGPGSADSAEVCTTLSAVDDNIVEGDEGFTVLLALTTPGPSLTILNNVTPVVIRDNDGRYIPWLHIFKVMFVLFLPVASFAMPANASIIEGDKAVIVCTSLEVTPVTATLGKDVMVTISTVEESGNQVILKFSLMTCDLSLHDSNCC